MMLRRLLPWIPFVIVVAIASYYVGTQWGSSELPPKVLGPYQEGKVRSRVQGVQGPAVKLGETVSLEAQLCASGTAAVHTDVFLHKLGNGSAREPVKLVSFDTTRVAACGPLTLNLPKDSAHGPGRYNIYGVDSVPRTGEALTWITEDFRVVQDGQ